MATEGVGSSKAVRKNYVRCQLRLAIDMHVA